MKSFKDFIGNKNLEESNNTIFNQFINSYMRDNLNWNDKSGLDVLKNSNKKFKNFTFVGPQIYKPGIFGENCYVETTLKIRRKNENNKNEYKGKITLSDFEINYEGEVIKFPINDGIRKYIGLANYFNEKNEITIYIDFVETREEVVEAANIILDVFDYTEVALKKLFEKDALMKNIVNTTDKLEGLYNLIKKD